MTSSSVTSMPLYEATIEKTTPLLYPVTLEDPKEVTVCIDGPNKIKDFDSLKTSTKTIMVYTNLTFDLFVLYYVLPTCPVKIPYSKKVSKSDIVAPYGGIFSIQRGKETRGVDTRLAKRKKDEKKNSRKKHIEHFLNQNSILMMLEGHHIHMMLFGDNIKVAGCRTDEDAILAVMILYENYLEPISVTRPCFSIKPGHTQPMFIFDTVMRNVDFSLNFDLDRKEVNNVFNEPEYIDTIFLSQFETTEQKSVNVKMFAKKPANFKYTCYTPHSPYLETLDENPFHKDSEAQSYNSLLVFASSKVILSGKYDEDMRKSYNFFVATLLKHRAQVEEKIDRVTEEEKDLFWSLIKRTE
jgi:hypothetical protein